MEPFLHRDSRDAGGERSADTIHAMRMRWCYSVTNHVARGGRYVAATGACASASAARGLAGPRAAIITLFSMVGSDPRNREAKRSEAKRSEAKRRAAPRRSRRPDSRADFPPAVKWLLAASGPAVQVAGGDTYIYITFFVFDFVRGGAGHFFAGWMIAAAETAIAPRWQAVCGVAVPVGRRLGGRAAGRDGEGRATANWTAVTSQGGSRPRAPPPAAGGADPQSAWSRHRVVIARAAMWRRKLHRSQNEPGPSRPESRTGLQPRSAGCDPTVKVMSEPGSHCVVDQPLEEAGEARGLDVRVEPRDQQDLAIALPKAELLKANLIAQR